MKNEKLKIRGFTLIELLVVIGILGILAVGLLAAIDPFEQLKKGRDTNLRNVTVEYVNAVTRYYATHGTMPWGDAALNTTTLADNTVKTYTQKLIDEGELKPEFQDALGDNAAKIYLTGKAAPDPIQAIVCFDPDSRSLSADATTLYDSSGVEKEGCEADADIKTKVATVCYWCAR